MWSNEPGVPTPGYIPLSVPVIRGNEWKYVKECLDTGWVSSAGTFVDRFEQQVASQLGVRYAVATTSGTAALHVALQVAGVRRDDEVLVSTLSFIAPANAVRYLGAWPVFIDAEPRYWQMDPEQVDAFLKHKCIQRNGAVYNKLTGRRVSAILPVHILGHPCDMDSILESSRQYGLPVIEDATESLGGKYKDRMIGSLGNIACLSFNGNKLLTTGGGGMIVTDNEAWARKARYLTTQAKDDPVEYVHNEIGYNYRLTNVQAAIGCAQMEQLDDFVRAKREIAARYREAFADMAGIQTMNEAPWARSTFWLYTILIDPKIRLDRRKLMKCYVDNGIQTRPLWQPLHHSLAHRSSAFYGNAAIADGLYQHALCLPCSVDLSTADQKRVVEVLLSNLTAREPSGSPLA